MSVTVQKISTDAPGRDPTPAAAHAQDLLVALTGDPALREALQSVVPAEALVFVADEGALAAQLLAGRIGVVVLDTTAASLEAAQLAQLAQRLHNQLPDLALIAAGDTGDQSALAPLVTAGTIYRFIHKPVSAQRVRLFVDAAWRRHESSVSASGSFPVLKQAGDERRGPGRGLLAAVAAVLVAIIAGGVWLSLRGGTPAVPRPVPVKRVAAAPPASVPPAPAAPAPSAAAIAQAKLDKAATAAEQALLAGNYAEAARLTEVARAIDPNHVRVLFLTAQLARLRAHPAAVHSRSRAAEESAAQPARPQQLGSSAAAAASPPLAAASKAAASADAGGAPGAAAARAPAAAPRVTAQSSSAPAGGSANAAAANAAAAAHTATAASAPPRPPVIVPLVKIHSVEPEYPLAARESGLTGIVDVDFTVRADGTVADVSISHAQPPKVFDQAALDAVRQWRYRPPQRNGYAVDQRARVRLRFTYQ